MQEQYHNILFPSFTDPVEASYSIQKDQSSLQ